MALAEASRNALADIGRFGPSQLINNIRGQPPLFRNAVITPGGRDDRHAEDSGCLPEKIDGSQPLFIIKEIQVVQEQYGAAVRGQVRKKIARGAVVGFPLKEREARVHWDAG